MARLPPLSLIHKVNAQCASGPARSRATLALAYAPEAVSRWEAMLLGYQRVPAAELLCVQAVTLRTPIHDIVSYAGVRAHCARCGEEILNRREIINDGQTLCLACAEGGYYLSQMD